MNVLSTEIKAIKIVQIGINYDVSEEELFKSAFYAMHYDTPFSYFVTYFDQLSPYITRSGDTIYLSNSHREKM